jgi:acyl-CoA synthetase (AMP-forming)/AMP-acid ligase II
VTIIYCIQMPLQRSIPAVLDQAARELPGREAVVDGERRVTIAELREQAVEVARALVATGVEPGDRVAIWAPNSARWIAASFGAYAAGASSCR